jgi:hypothetical protein
VAALYSRHTGATDQLFEPEAIERAWHWTEGQPWLVNALARQVVEKDLKRDYSLSVTADHIDNAAEALMRRRDTHIDSLPDRLKEPRVRQVIEPIRAGANKKVSLFGDGTRFCLDLGLLKIDDAGALKPANPLYREVIVRTLTFDSQAELPANLINRRMDGKSLDMAALLKEFRQFWRENADARVGRYEYREAAPHRILQAFLQRVANGGAAILREMAAGRGRVDIGVVCAGRKCLVEVKLAGREPPDRSLAQTAGYMDDDVFKRRWRRTCRWRDRRPRGEAGRTNSAPGRWRSG